MAHYINADTLRDRIKKNKYVIEPMFLKGDDSYYEGEDDGYNRVLSIIDSLQQEQPEVDLKEEIAAFFSKNPIPHEHITDWPLLKNTALHFFNLGLNARKV